MSEPTMTDERMAAIKAASEAADTYFVELEKLSDWIISCAFLYGNEDYEFRERALNDAKGTLKQRLALLAASEARTAALEKVATAARIEAARADRFGCRELRAALAALDGGSEDAGV